MNKIRRIGPRQLISKAVFIFVGICAILWQPVRAQDGCACSPKVYTITLDLSGSCENVTGFGDGILLTDCSVRPFSDAMERAEDELDLVPVSVSIVDISELGQNLQTVVGRMRFEGEPLVTGTNITYTSVAGTSDDADDLPKAINLSMVGVNANGEQIVFSGLLAFSNSCEQYPLILDNAVNGWAKMIEEESPDVALCPLAPTESPIATPPTTSPTLSPVAATEAPVAASTDMPSRAATTPSEATSAPSVLPNTEEPSPSSAATPTIFPVTAPSDANIPSMLMGTPMPVPSPSLGVPPTEFCEGKAENGSMTKAPVPLTVGKGKGKGKGSSGRMENVFASTKSSKKSKSNGKGGSTSKGKGASSKSKSKSTKSSKSGKGSKSKRRSANYEELYHNIFGHPDENAERGDELATWDIKDCPGHKEPSTPSSADSADTQLSASTSSKSASTKSASTPVISTEFPTVQPSERVIEPTLVPTVSPTASPSASPTQEPSLSPTVGLADVFSAAPSVMVDDTAPATVEAEERKTNDVTTKDEVVSLTGPVNSTPHDYPVDGAIQRNSNTGKVMTKVLSAFAVLMFVLSGVLLRNAWRNDKRRLEAFKVQNVDDSSFEEDLSQVLEASLISRDEQDMDDQLCSPELLPPTEASDDSSEVFKTMNEEENP